MTSFHGFFLLDKPQGITSHDLVIKMRKILETPEVGHCGTLDPMATGLMIIGVGEALKLVSLLIEENKCYQGEVFFGISTDTLDFTGNILSTGSWPQSEREILDVLPQVTGELELSIPKFSAIKMSGEALHVKARKGIQFEPPLKKMNFFSIESLGFSEKRWKFRLKCSKGSYVRSWVEALSKALNYPACLSQLRRISIGSFQLESAITLEYLTQLKIDQNLESLCTHSCWIPLEQALTNCIEIRVGGFDLYLLQHGQISKNLRNQLIRCYQPHRSMFSRFKVLSLTQPSYLVALIELDKGKGFYIKRGFKMLATNDSIFKSFKRQDKNSLK